VGLITMVGCLVFFFSLRTQTQVWFLIWNVGGLAVYLAWSAWNSRLAKGEETQA
jgi:basic amino acid/polyamine antiporter, APA family